MWRFGTSNVGGTILRLQELSEVPRPTVPLTTPPRPHPVAGTAPAVVEAEGDPRTGPQYRAALELEVWKEQKEKEFMAEVSCTRGGLCVYVQCSWCFYVRVCVCMYVCHL